MLIREIPWLEPFAAALAWADEPTFALLESGGPVHDRARHCYLAVEPFQVLQQRGSGVELDGVRVEGTFLDRLAHELERFKTSAPPEGLPFGGGAVGFIGYDLAREIGGVATSGRRPADDQVAAAFGFYDVVIAFDRLVHRAWICATGDSTRGAEGNTRARMRIEAVAARLATLGDAAPSVRSAMAIEWRCLLSQRDYEARVARIIEHIRAGDIYQANFTCRHAAHRPAGLSAVAFYQSLRERSPAPFGALLGFPGVQLASVSPERFIRLDADGRMETRPIKGTRPRGGTPAEDEALAHELTSSVKDHAENLMIVDLMRNDLGRVAGVGSVTVPSLCALESFASVHHLVSEVRAELRPGLGPIELLRATLPGGSITGAPKIRAMQIIHEVEGSPRGAYCGIIGWIGFDGAMDTSIAIRTVTLTPDLLEAQAGGGIVADSDPADEFAEMLVKVAPLLVDCIP